MGPGPVILPWGLSNQDEEMSFGVGPVIVPNLPKYKP